MRRIAAILGSAIFLVIAPGIVAGLRALADLPMAGWSTAAGNFLISVLRGVVDCGRARHPFGFVRPLRAPRSRYACTSLSNRHLAVSGLFRYVRNPMYVAVVSLILGQGLFFGSVRVLEYGTAVWAAFHLFVLIYEEFYLAENLRS